MLTIVLFDVDGTLVLTGGAGRRALALGFADVLGREDALEGIGLGGMTDRLIARTGLRNIGHHEDEATIDAVLDAYLARLPGEIEHADGYRIMPGVHDALDALRRSSDYAIGLGTGNLRQGAQIKLARGELYEAFEFGGFGCDHEDRVELLRAGALRGASHLGSSLSACRLVVVGDTPRDVDAARALGAECVGVGTGSYRADDLRRAGATVAFEDLTVNGALDALFGR